MQRKPGFPVANCNIKMPDRAIAPEPLLDDESEQQRRRQQLINFGHSQWGFNNWSWGVTKQDLDFVDFVNGKYSAGVVAFVNINVKNLDIHRENIGYATATAFMKGSAVHQARKGAVTNALRETLLSFGDSVATELLELLEAYKTEISVNLGNPINTVNPVSTVNPVNLVSTVNPAKAPVTVTPPAPVVHSVKVPTTVTPLVPVVHPVKVPATVTPPVPVVHPVKVPATVTPPAPVVHPAVNVKRVVTPVCGVKTPCEMENNQNMANKPTELPPVARALPMRTVAPPSVRPNNVSFVLQPVMTPLYPPRPPLYHNYYEYPWHYSYDPYDRHHNFNFNIPPKNLRTGLECKNRPEGEPLQYVAPPNQGCWIKPTIFYDGFWTEQKVNKWVAEQVDKHCPGEVHSATASITYGHLTADR